ncbi:hypothetical protein [Sphingomonas sp. M1A8_2b]
MTDPLTMNRFRDLADAYGAVVARWPDRYHEQAARLATTREGSAILAEAACLDARLDGWRVEGRAQDLAAMIVASGTIATRRAALRLRWWWSGVGIAATLAGAAAGSAAVAISVPIDLGHGVGAAADMGAINGSTSFGYITGSDR